MKEHSILKCTVCGVTAEIIDGCTCGEESIFQCCGKSMVLMEEKTADMAKEKHVPVATPLTGGGTKVVVGSTPHPMTPEHYIEWIEIINGAYTNRYRLKPGDAPEAVFHVQVKPGMVIREYCNIHGLWVNKI